MKNKPKILSNEFDAVPKWDWYQAELDEPELKKQIIKAFSQYEEKAKEHGKLSVELQDRNYKIDKNMSLDKKLKHWWKKITGFHSNSAQVEEGCPIVLLKKDLWGGAYVREYLEWVPKEYIWEQKFNRAAVSALWLRDRLPSVEEFHLRYIRNKSKFVEDRKNHLSGARASIFVGIDNDDLRDIGAQEFFFTREVDSNGAPKIIVLDSNLGFNCSWSDKNSWFSIRLKTVI